MSNLNDSVPGSDILEGDFVEGSGNFEALSWQISAPLEFNPRYQLDRVAERATADKIALIDTDSAKDDASAKSYAAGFTDGTKAAMTEHENMQSGKKHLADAIENLGKLENKKLTELLWKAVHHLTQEALGEHIVDRDKLLERCEAAADQIDRDMGTAVLHVAPSDIGLLQDFDISVALIPDPKLPSGSVHLVHEGGEYISGSAAIIHAIDGGVRLEGSSKC